MEMEVEAVKPKRAAHDVLEDTRTAMEEIAAKMLFIKKEARPKSDLKELITNMSLLFITLRQVSTLSLSLSLIFPPKSLKFFSPS